MCGVSASNASLLLLSEHTLYSFLASHLGFDQMTLGQDHGSQLRSWHIYFQVTPPMQSFSITTYGWEENHKFFSKSDLELV